jgi:hypothetical protein
MSLHHDEWKARREISGGCAQQNRKENMEAKFERRRQRQHKKKSTVDFSLKGMQQVTRDLYQKAVKEGRIDDVCPATTNLSGNAR